jgi:hypothetical protein
MAAPTDQQLLDAYRSAALALATAQSYKMQDGRELTRVDLPNIMKAIGWLEQRVASAVNPGDATGSY